MAPTRCAKFRSLLSAYLDGELSPREHLDVQGHLQDCPACAASLESLKATCALIADLPEIVPPPSFHAALSERVRAEAAAVRRSNVAGGGRSRLSPVLENWGAAVRRWNYRGVAVAAALVVLVLWAGSFTHFLVTPFFLDKGAPGADAPPGAGDGLLSGMGESGDGSGDGSGDDYFTGNNLDSEPRSSGSDGLGGAGASGAPGIPGGAAGGDLGILSAESAAARQIILTAYVSLHCEDVAEVRDRVIAATEAAGGFIESLTYWSAGDGQVTDQSGSATMTLRVPSRALPDVLAQLHTFGSVLNEQISRTDVTAQYRDLSVRVENLREQEQRLLALLGRAENLSEVLVLENELNRVRTQIEQYEMILRSYDEQSTFSTIRLDLSQGLTPAPGDSFWDRVVQAFVRSLEWLGRAAEAVALFLVGALPIVAIAGGLAWAGLAVVRSRRRKAGM